MDVGISSGYNSDISRNNSPILLTKKIISARKQAKKNLKKTHKKHNTTIKDLIEDGGAAADISQIPRIIEVGEKSSLELVECNTRSHNKPKNPHKKTTRVDYDTGSEESILKKSKETPKERRIAGRFFNQKQVCELKLDIEKLPQIPPKIQIEASGESGSGYSPILNKTKPELMEIGNLKIANVDKAHTEPLELVEIKTNNFAQVEGSHLIQGELMDFLLENNNNKIKSKMHRKSIENKHNVGININDLLSGSDNSANVSSCNTIKKEISVIPRDKIRKSLIETPEIGNVILTPTVSMENSLAESRKSFIALNLENIPKIQPINVNNFMTKELLLSKVRFHTLKKINL
ncbi:hypothetical protein BB561_005392 [Smittium simulii]|uniref:Uncharacterized protein n=1 Tax=Smittium simulii TaxID=133385 RepID=A0A2T9YAR9_9FUNG|nr:hypothetical protein BB561_005392 [Smittium simulii]